MVTVVVVVGLLEGMEEESEDELRRRRKGIGGVRKMGKMDMGEARLRKDMADAFDGLRSRSQIGQSQSRCLSIQ